MKGRAGGGPLTLILILAAELRSVSSDAELVQGGWLDLEGNSGGSGVFEGEPLVRGARGLLLSDGDSKGRGANQRLDLD